jgi:hypothetical protein
VGAVRTPLARLPDNERRPVRAALILLCSVAVVLPCFWQSRIQAGDLSSHVYNAWLASLAEQGKVPGLVLVSQWTNSAFDLALAWLIGIFGIPAAQRLLIAASVEIFFWGGFMLTRVVAGRMPWFLMPCFAMLAYGSVFHFGFFGFYLSMGMCLWALAALWGGGRAIRLIAVPLLVFAAWAHALPVAWTLCVAVYAWLARRTSRRIALAACALGAMIALRLVLTLRFLLYSSIRQILFLSGADQTVIYDAKYLFISLALLLVWLAAWMHLLRQRKLRDIATEVPFQLLLLTALGVLLMPVALHIPLYRHTLWYITDRMSLATAVMVCVVLGSAHPPKALKAAMAVLAAVFFSFLYFDGRALNAVEDRVEALLSTLPAGQRVVNGLVSAGRRIDPLRHIVDRACTGRCFSYDNYAPSTAQFRLRAVAPNEAVVSEYRDSYELQEGTYVVKPRDLPLHQMACAPRGGLRLRELRSGETSGVCVFQW